MATTSTSSSTKTSAKKTTATKRPTKKAKSPLYVVTNKGSVVQSVDGFFDLMVKKFNLAPVINLLQQMMNLMLTQAKSYAVVKAIKEQLDVILAALNPILKMVKLA